MIMIEQTEKWRWVCSGCHRKGNWNQSWARAATLMIIHHASKCWARDSKLLILRSNFSNTLTLDNIRDKSPDDSKWVEMFSWVEII